MNVFQISLKSILSSKLTAALNLLLIAFGIGILTLLLLGSAQLSKKLENNSKDIDLVVGAKGSPLQLILSSIFYVDFPTGNIPLKDAELIAKNPMVKRAVPLALGDNYQGFRIVGTDTSYINLYGLKLKEGRFWSSDFEVCVGSNVAEQMKLKIGQRFFGAHGLTGNSDVHKTHAYMVTGILASQGNVTDNLVMTNIASVWRMHEEPGNTALAPGQPASSQNSPNSSDSSGQESFEGPQREITSLLIQYKSYMSVVIFPRMVNQSTSMQAASPAMESSRLFSLIGVGVDTIQWFAILIMVISAISVFISLYNSMKERSYDLAVMRTMGASRTRLFLIVLIEGTLLTVIGSISGLALGHLALFLISHFQDSAQAKLSGSLFLPQELYLVAAGFGIGILASLIPAIGAYRTDISKVLSR